IVNHLGNENPGIILRLHEDHSVAIAHGYAKATGEPMACVLHSNVGLLHGMMGLFNAWCDRVPMLVLGATGPVAAEKRRPWIDWIHTSRDQGAYIRSIIKWDDQPTSADSLVESMVRGNLLTRSAPTAPVYIVLDAGFQETRLDKEPEWPEVKRFMPPKPPRPRKAAGAGGGRGGGRHSVAGQAAADPARPRLAQRRILAAAHPAGRAPRCLRVHRFEAGRDVPDRPRGPLHAAVQRARQRRARPDVRGGRNPRARLDGPRRCTAPGQERRHSDGEDHQRYARP